MVVASCCNTSYTFTSARLQPRTQWEDVPSSITAVEFQPAGWRRAPVKKLRKQLANVFAKTRRRNDAPIGESASVVPLREAPGRVEHNGTELTGRTIYGDRPLRMRRMTVVDPDLPSITDPTAFEGAFKIRVAHLAYHPREAQVLVERRYRGRGYQIPVVSRDPYLMTFLAYDEGRVVGTVSVRLDSVQKGLSADELYGAELDDLRTQGARMCEFTRLAVDAAVASKPVLATLFHTAYLYAAVVRQYTHSVIEVNPRHASFYNRALKFERIGPVRFNTRVKAAAVLLGVPFATIGEGIAQYAGKSEVASGRGSLFQYGFPAHEQEGVLHRLKELAS